MIGITTKHKKTAVCLILAIYLGLSCSLLFADTLDVDFLGASSWLTGPESLANRNYMLSSPNPLAQCSDKVNLWVMDIGVTIFNEQNQLEMIVGGDTFYNPQQSEQSCLHDSQTKVAWCRDVKLPLLQDAYIKADCVIDADCPIAPNGFKYRCAADKGLCVTDEVYQLCTNLFDNSLLPKLVGFCFETRGSHANFSEILGKGKNFCDWIQADHRCMTELYDDTCDLSCLTSEHPQCQNPCTTECIQACNKQNRCHHRNNVFFKARLEDDNMGGSIVRLIRDYPQYIIRRDANECMEAELFGVYPVDYFLDDKGNTYLFSSTQVWLAQNMSSNILGAGIGIYSMTKKYRLSFHDYLADLVPARIWPTSKAADQYPKAIKGTNRRIVWQRGSKFTHLSVVHGLEKSPHEPENTANYIFVLGAGPVCSAEQQNCLRSEYTSKAFLARIKNDEASISNPYSWEYFAGSKDGKVRWQKATDKPHGQTQAATLFGIDGFAPSNIMHFENEYWHIGVVPSNAAMPSDSLQLLRSPDGINWYDAGSYPLIAHEKPQRTRYIYSPYWLAKTEQHGKLPFLLSHWLSYEGFFVPQKSKRFRDYNMRSYQLKTPDERAFITYSKQYSVSDKTLIMPVTVYQSRYTNTSLVTVQYCECSESEVIENSCLHECAAFTGFDGNAKNSRWKFATMLDGTETVLLKNKKFRAFKISPTKSKKLIAKDMAFIWNFEREPKPPTDYVVLRFGIYQESDKNPYAAMHRSTRILPLLHKHDWLQLQNPLGWHTSLPIKIKNHAN